MNVLATCLAIAALAQPAAVDDATVVARVDGESITLLQVKRVLVGALQGKTIPAEALPLVQAQSLEQAINRRLVTARLKQEKYEPTADELKQAQENFEVNIGLAGLTREEYLRRNALTDADLDELRYFDIAANRYARERLDDEALQKYFDEHHRDFDGTELRVSHILWRVEGRSDPVKLRGMLEKAKQVREEITSGKLKFADAATKYSAGPSRESGGDLGFIPRRDRMVEEFSSVAFKLKKDEVSQPTITPFGVHLITVTDERPGKIAWTEVRDGLRAAAQAKLFNDLAVELRKTAKIEYTGVLPHIDLGTGTLVPAGK